MPSPLFFILPLSPAHYRHLRHIVTNRLIIYVFLCDARCDDKFCVTRRADACGEIALRRCRGRHWRPARGYIFYLNPSVTAYAVPASRKGEPLHSLSLAFGSPAPSTGSLLVRFISLHIKPALKGEVANVVSRRGYKAAYSSLFVTTPQSRLTPCQLPVRGAFRRTDFTACVSPPCDAEFIVTPCVTQKNVDN